MAEGLEAAYHSPPASLRVREDAAWHRVQGFLPRSESSAARGRPAASRALLDLVQVVDLLRDAGIPAVPLKGPLLGERLWGDPTVRVGHDIDVLVPPDQAGKAGQALRGITSRLPVSDEYHHLGFRLSSGRTLELHSAPLGPRTGWRASVVTATLARWPTAPVAYYKSGTGSRTAAVIPLRPPGVRPMSEQHDAPSVEPGTTRQDVVRKVWTSPTIERVAVLTSTNKIFSILSETTTFGPAGS